MADNPGLTKFTQALNALAAYDLEEAGKLLVARLDDAALMRHRGYCFDEEPRRRERERERERALVDGTISAVQALRASGALPVPQPVEVPDTLVVDGEVYAADQSTVFVPGERVWHDQHLLQKTTATSHLPNDFGDRAAWVDISPHAEQEA